MKIRFATAALTLAALSAAQSAASLAAQEDQRWQITLDQDQYVWDVRLLRLDGDSLVVRQADSSLRVPVELISEIRLIRKSEMRLGDGAEAAIQKIFLYHPSDP